MWHENQLGNPSRPESLAVARSHRNKATRAFETNLGQQIRLVAGLYHNFVGPTKRLGKGNPEGLEMHDTDDSKKASHPGL